MAKWVARIWAGIVGAVAGACIGLVATLLLMVARGSHDLVWVVGMFALLGAVVGFALGNRKLGGK